MAIITVFYEFLNRVIRNVQMFYLKPLKINLNIVSKTVSFGIYGCILIEFIYCIFVEDAIVSCLNFYAILKKKFWLVLELCLPNIFKIFKTPIIYEKC